MKFECWKNLNFYSFNSSKKFFKNQKSSAVLRKIKYNIIYRQYMKLRKLVLNILYYKINETQAANEI